MEAIFEALSACAALHPDPKNDDDDEDMGLDDDADDAFVDADAEGFQAISAGADGGELSEAGRVRSDFINNSRYKPY